MVVLALAVPLSVTVTPATHGPVTVPESVQLVVQVAKAKGDPLLATPNTVTTTLPVVAAFGTVTVMLVELQLVAVAAVPLKVTVLEPCACVVPKFVPVMVTDDPTAPEIELSEVIVGGASTTSEAVLLVAPAPLSVELIALVVLVTVPATVPVTLMLKVQDPLAASVAPDKLTKEEAATAVIVPPPHEPLRPLGDDTTRPPASVSVKAIPLCDPKVLVLLIVKVNEVEPFSTIAPAPKALVMVGGPTTFTVAVSVAVVPAALVTVRVYVVVVKGVMFTAVPLVTVPTPLLTLPVPALNTAVSVVEVPAVILAAPATKLVATGGGTTVTVAVEVTAVPAAFVTVRVYVVAVVGPMVTAVPLITAPTLVSTEPVPPVNTAVSVVEVPSVIVVFAATKLVITGAATTVTVTGSVAVAPAAFVTVRVYVVVAEGVMFTAVPLVTVPTPLLTLPVPPLNTAVSVVEVPAVIVAFAATKLVATGGATTVKVKFCVAAVPTPFGRRERYRESACAVRCRGSGQCGARKRHAGWKRAPSR